MSIAALINHSLRPFGLRVSRLPRNLPAPVPTASDYHSQPYDQDGLFSVHNHEFMGDPRFCRAYARGLKATGGVDYKWHWRVHVGLWAAQQAALLDGDFVECGVNYGFLSSAIMEDLDWNRLGRRFFLLDSFGGHADDLVTAGTVASDFYNVDVDRVRQNFAQWPSAEITVGLIPATLSAIDSTRIAFANIDLNNAPAEIAAMVYLWDRLVPGALVVFDDYAYRGFRAQHLALDAFAAERGVSILSLPTGQGLLIKPGKR